MLKLTLIINFCKIFHIIFYNIEIDHYSIYWILKHIAPENVFPVCVRIIFIHLRLSLKFCILQYIDIFCTRQILHRMRGWLGIGMTYLEMNPEFLENICKWYVSSISQFEMIEIICLSSSCFFLRQWFYVSEHVSSSNEMHHHFSVFIDITTLSQAK